MLGSLKQKTAQWLAPVMDPAGYVEAQQPHPPAPGRHVESFLKQLELRLTNRMRSALAGEQKSLTRGHGLDFADLREYMAGDDIRKIDWNVFARTLTPHIKEYHEEKQLTIWFVADLSPSMFFGHTKTKAHQLLELIGMLGLLIQKGHHKMGLYAFSAEQDVLVPPRPGYVQLQHMLKKLFKLSETEQRVIASVPPDYFAQCCQKIDRMLPRHAVVFFLSDFLSLQTGWEKAMDHLGRHTTLYHLLLEDEKEQQIPPQIGVIQLLDPETRTMAVVDTNNPKHLAQYQELFTIQRTALLKTLKITGKLQIASTETPAEETILSLLRAP